MGLGKELVEVLSDAKVVKILDKSALASIDEPIGWALEKVIKDDKREKKVSEKIPKYVKKFLKENIAMKKPTGVLTRASPKTAAVVGGSGILLVALVSHLKPSISVKLPFNINIDVKPREDVHPQLPAAE